MERSADELISLKFRKAKLCKRIEEIGSKILGTAWDLLPLSFKETSPVVPSASMVQAGDWYPLEDNRIPIFSQNSIVWLRKRFQLQELPENWTWCLHLLFTEACNTDKTVEGAIWIDGRIRQGLDVNHQVVLLQDLDLDQEHEVTIRINFKPSHKERIIKEAGLTPFHLPSFRLYERLKCIFDIVDKGNTDNPAILKLMDLMEGAIRFIPFTDPGSDDYYTGVTRAEEEFYFPGDWEKVSATIRSFGHAHIDVAWLWTLDETRRKAVQTFATACQLMKEYPNFVFLQSQPILYDFAEKQEPELFQRITEYVEEGRWIPEGSSWVEPDCNIPSGESLVRQILHGTRYVKEKFGKTCEILWLPDTFGFNANLPQIMRKAGINYFSTSKISWSAYTRFPYDAFRWQGIDGSEVLSMFLTAHHKPDSTAATYNGWLIPAELKQGWETFAQKAVFDEVLLSFGFGDGGGGATREMLERVPVLKDAPTLPRLVMGSPIETFRKMEAVRDKLPAWRGELYLQYHRGTLTSRGRIKHLHRRAETALALMERAVSLDMLARQRNITGEERETLDYLWKIFLTNEFHDIIAGSSIHEVNEEAESDLARITEEANRRARRLISGWNWEGKGQSKAGDTDGEVIFNPHTFPVAMVLGDPEKKRLLHDLRRSLPVRFPRHPSQSGNSVCTGEGS